MKQSLAKLHQKAAPNIKADNLAWLIKQGLSYEPSFLQAIPFIEMFYQLIPPVWMNTFSDSKIMKLLITQIKPQYASIILKYSQVQPGELKSAVQKRFTRQFLSFEKQIKIYKTTDPNKLLALTQQNTTKLEYLFNYAVRWMALQIDVNFIIRWLLLVHPTSKSHHDLANMLINQIITSQKYIKWDQLYTMCTLKLNGGGNISTLFARMPLSSSEITAKLYPHMVSQNFPISSFIKIMMNFSCPTKVVEITQCIIKKLYYDKKIKLIEDIFNKFCKPILLKHMANSIYYMQFDKIMRCLMEIPQAQYTFSNQQVAEIMNKLNIYKPRQHMKLMEDIIGRYSSPQSKIKLQSVKQSLLHQTKINNQSMHNTHILLKKKESFEDEKQSILQCQNLIGLPNIGNSCYMNSFIISLYFCPQFFNAMTQNQYQFKDKSLSYLREIFIYLTRKESQNLSKVLFAFKNTLPPEFSNNSDQQDAMDFGRELLNKLIPTDPRMSDLFESKFSQIFRCMDGHIHSKVSSVESHLILNFPNPQVFASMIKGNQMPQGLMLEELLKYSFQTVTLDNNYTCSKCNKPFKKINKQMYIAKLPKILILCISRFAYNLKCKKILDRILAKQALKIAEQNNKKTYKLVSFLNHMGSTSNSGHYQAYISNVENQQQNWINFDDDYVTQVTVKNTTELFNNFNAYDTPYILFYEQIQEAK